MIVLERNKKIILVSHCILNSNSKVEGLSQYSGILYELVNLIAQKGIGIIQLPCPELIMYGIKRWGHVKEQFDTPYFREKSRELLKPIISQVIDYEKNGYSILGVIGIDGSPSCGVNKTCSANWGGELSGDDKIISKINNIKSLEEPGIFIEELKKQFEENKLDIPFTAIDEININSNINEIKKFLNEGEIDNEKN